MKHLTDQELLAHTNFLVKKERNSLLDVLHAFREIEKRKLYAPFGSLWEMACTEFGYSRPAAGRRIQAMRLLKERPDFEEKIESGELCLTATAQAMSFLRSKEGKALAPKKRQEFLDILPGASTRRVTKAIRTLAPLAMPKTRQRRINAELTEIRLLVNDRQREKFEKARAHTDPSLGYEELFERLTDQAFPEESPAPKAETQTVTPKLKKHILSRDGYRCTHVHEGKRCEHTQYLEVDHILPKCLGGTNEPKNLRTLCRTHNQSEADRKLGKEFMDRFRA